MQINQNDIYFKFPTTADVFWGGGGFHLKEIVGITGGLDFTLGEEEEL